MTKKPKPDKGSDWPGPRIARLRRALKKLAASIARKRKRRAAQRKKKSRRRHGSSRSAKAMKR
jgi:hypothetical protein